MELAKKCLQMRWRRTRIRGSAGDRRSRCSALIAKDEFSAGRISGSAARPRGSAVSGPSAKSLRQLLCVGDPDGTSCRFDEPLRLEGLEYAVGMYVGQAEHIADVLLPERQADGLSLPLPFEGALIKLQQEVADTFARGPTTQVGNVLVEQDAITGAHSDHSQPNFGVLPKKAGNPGAREATDADRGQADGGVRDGRPRIGLKAEERAGKQHLEDLALAVVHEMVDQDPATGQATYLVEHVTFVIDVPASVERSLPGPVAIHDGKLAVPQWLAQPRVTCQTGQAADRKNRHRTQASPRVVVCSRLDSVGVVDLPIQSVQRRPATLSENGSNPSRRGQSASVNGRRFN